MVSAVRVFYLLQNLESLKRKCYHILLLTIATTHHYLEDGNWNTQSVVLKKWPSGIKNVSERDLQQVTLKSPF